MSNISQPTTVLGSVYTDSVTGFKGTCTSKIEYLHDAPQSLLVGKADKNGKYESQWYNNARLQLVKAPVKKAKSKPVVATKK